MSARDDRNARYIESGYSPRDGLGYGHWVTRPGSAGIRDWVGEVESHKSCATCSASVSSRATYCGACKRARELVALRAKREAA